MTDKIRTVLGTIIFPIITIAILMAVILIYVPQIFSSNGVLVVNSTADTNDGNCNAANCTLREAITAANNSPGEDSINFSLPANATITLGGTQLPIISGTLAIDGSTAVNLTINGDNESRVFVIDEAPPPYPRPGKSDRVGGIVTINDLTIINGNDDYGGTISNSGNLVLVDNILSDGNAIYGNIYNTSILTITGGTFSSNLSSEGGGVLYNVSDGNITISDSLFINNTADGGYYNRGGVIFNFGSVDLFGSTFANNVAGDTNTRGLGGAIFNNTNGRMVSDKNVFTGNNASYGGAIWNASFGTATITDSSFEMNEAFYRDGGAIYNNGTMSIVSSTLNDNTAFNRGGGIYGAYSNSQASVANSTFHGNSGMFGGAIYHDGGTFYLINSTLSENSADDGSGIHVRNLFHLRNTIIGNSVGGEDCNVSGFLSTNINNLIEDGTCISQYAGDPKLGPLQDNGGDTRTHALLAASPAIDTGDPDTCADAPIANLDQRGENRPEDGNGDGTAVCDIGAYEVGESQIYYYYLYLPASMKS